MSTVLRVEHASLSGGFLEFSDEEVTLTDVLPLLEREVVRSQARRAWTYETGPEIVRLTLTFRAARASTFSKLHQIRRATSAFLVFPYLPFDDLSSLTMIWPDPDVVFERLRAGYPLANYEIQAVWEEQAVDACLPPS